MSDEHWHRWDEAVGQYIQAMRSSRAAGRLLKQRYAQTYSTLKKGGKGVEDAKQGVYDDPHYIAAWQESDEAEIAEKQARLALDKLQMQFEEWRTRQSTKRAEMNLR